jgi:hypothetical protein
MTRWTFVFATDIHVGSPRSFRFQPAWNENWRTARGQIVRIAPELLLLGGDLARDGRLHRFELEAVKTDLDALPFPRRVVPGNMDTGNKHTARQGPRSDRDDLDLNLTSRDLANWSAVFGPAWWTFVHRGVRFTGICDMLAGSGLPEEKAFWLWMQGLSALPRAERHVWVMHSPLFIADLHEPDFDIADPEWYLSWYFGVDEPQRGRITRVMKETGVELVLSGHVHCRKTHWAEGIRFEIGPSTAFSQWGERWPDGDPALGFLRCDVTEAGIEPAFVPLDRLSTAAGYGPGGHPLSRLRDYSIAWEK